MKQPAPLTRREQKQLRAELFDLQHGLCAYCDEQMSALGGRMCTLEHVLPLVEGGTWDRFNLVAACWQCNRLKGSLTLEQLRRLLARVEAMTRIASNTHHENAPGAWNTGGDPETGADAATRGLSLLSASGDHRNLMDAPARLTR